MITAIFLRDETDLQAIFAPFGGDDIATAVGVGFFEAGRFGDYKTAERVDHLREGWVEGSFLFSARQREGALCEHAKKEGANGQRSTSHRLPGPTEDIARHAGRI